MPHLARRSAPPSLLVLALLALCAVWTAPAHAAGASRTWVSGVGDDVNPCSRTAPCKTFAGAISKTTEGGEINVLDPGGFGGVTITKSITIDAAGVEAGVLVSGTNGIIVNAPADADVVLRGLDIFGVDGASYVCPRSGLNGIRVLAAHSVTVEDTRIAQFNGAGIDASPTTDVHVYLNNVDIRNNCTTGIDVNPAAGKRASVVGRDVTLVRTGLGVHAHAGASVALLDSFIGFNPLGIDQDGGVVSTDAATSFAFNTKDQKLHLTMDASSITRKRGRRVLVGNRTTTPVTETLRVVKGGKTKAKVVASFDAGHHVIRWNGKFGHKFAPKGTYTLTLVATTTDGQTATGTATLTIT